ncbi:MAG: T9SS type A sorting domain-containing protein, partial [Bacteroidota bacterium]
FQVWVALPDGTTFPLDEVVGINELANQVSDFLIMPNPVSSQATIQYTLTEELELNLNIYDMNGKMVRSQYMGSQAPDTYTNTVDVSNLPQGVYHYSMVSPKGVLTKRLVVTRR